MKEKILYGIWAALYVLCVGLGMLVGATGVIKAILVCVAVLFFVPGAMLLYDGLRRKDRAAVVRLRIIALTSLLLTLVMLVVNFLSITMPAAVGSAVYEVLALVSAPMFCGQYWFISLFLWACLLFASFHKGIQKPS